MWGTARTVVIVMTRNGFLVGLFLGGQKGTVEILSQNSSLGSALLRALSVRGILVWVPMLFFLCNLVSPPFAV
jgi:hypothetical protein